MAIKSTTRPAQGRTAVGRARAEATGATEASGVMTDRGPLALLCLTGWAIPGAAHFWLGKRQKGTVFLVSLMTMFVTGLLLKGRLFPFDVSEPLVALAALANAGMGLPWIVSLMLDAGRGVVTAVSYEYGNCFLIVAGLLNFLVVLDAFDVAVGRK